MDNTAAAARSALKAEQELWWVGASGERLHQYLATFLGEVPADWTVAGINAICYKLPHDQKEFTRIRLTAALQEYQARIAAHK